jgi:ribosomal-protein-alanine N-acetyltransferase
MKIEYFHNIKPVQTNELISLDEKFFDWPWSADSWHKFFDAGRDFLILLQRDEDNIVGLALFELTSASSQASLYKILIHDDYKGQGYGTELLHSSLNWLQQNHYDQIILEVDVKNTQAIGLYQKHKFEVIHCKKNFYRNGSDAYVMELKLS